jgi:hypothetical protein
MATSAHDRYRIICENESLETKKPINQQAWDALAMNLSKDAANALSAENKDSNSEINDKEFE